MSSEQRSPLIFILEQLEAAEKAVQQASNPLKRPRGRPPKQEEPPLLPNAIRHVLSDEDSEEDKRLLMLEQKLEQVATAPTSIRQVLAKTNSTTVAVIIPTGDKYTCIFGAESFGVSKHADYWEYHYAKGDLRKAANADISKFVHVNADGFIETITSAKLLLSAGIKGAKLSADALLPAELLEIQAALQGNL